MNARHTEQNASSAIYHNDLLPPTYTKTKMSKPSPLYGFSICFVRIITAMMTIECVTGNTVTRYSLFFLNVYLSGVQWRRGEASFIDEISEDNKFLRRIC